MYQKDNNPTIEQTTAEGHQPAVFTFNYGVNKS